MPEGQESEPIQQDVEQTVPTPKIRITRGGGPHIEISRGTPNVIIRRGRPVEPGEPVRPPIRIERKLPPEPTEPTRPSIRIQRGR